MEQKKLNTAPNISSRVKEEGLNPAIRGIGKVEIEDVVENTAAYKVWLKLEENEWLNEQRIQGTSDNGEVDLAILHHQLRKKIAHLPEPEQVEIMRMKDCYVNARLKANVWKKKAFGLNQGHTKTKGGKVINARFALVMPRERELIELFGRMFTLQEVMQICVEDWGLPVNQKLLGDFRNFHADVISAKIENHKRSFADLRLGIKRSRLEEYCWMYHELKQDYRKNRSVKMVEQMRGVLSDIRREVEGDKLVIDGKLDINLEAEVNSHLQNDILRHMSLRSLIIGRVAARLNILPDSLIARLNASYYANLGGVVGDIEETDYEELKYPNETKPYDFEAIRAAQPALQEVNQSLTVKTTEAGKSLREKLLAVAASKVRELEREQTKLQIVLEPTFNHK